MLNCMNHCRKILLFLTIFSFVGCVSEYVPEPTEFHHKLVVIAELEADVAPEFIVSTTYNLDSEPLVLKEGNTTVEVFDTQNFGEANAFRQNKVGDIKWNPPGQFIPRSGKEYSLVVNISDPSMDMLPVEGLTMIPESGDFANLEAVTYNQSNNFTQFNIGFSLDTPPDSNNFYHVIPFIRVGAVDFPLEIDKITEGINGSYVLSHRDGMLIDLTRLDESNSLKFRAKSLAPVNISQIDNPRMFYKLKTVTPEYFYYHQNISQSNLTNLGPFTLPLLTYSQFIDENATSPNAEPIGYGVFSAVSSVERSVEIIK